jgi:polar amino acid transport system substrate-binding protein
MRKYFTLAAAATVVAASTLTACGGSSTGAADGCKPRHKFSTVADRTLTVSTFDLPPYTKVEGNKITGVDGQILDEIAKRECLTIKAMPLDASAVIPAVQRKRADVAVGDWYRTAERAKIVALSDPIYTDQMGIISKGKVDSVPGLKGKKVGTVDGYLWVEELETYLGDSLTKYPSSTAMWQDLKSGRIDIGVDSYGSAIYANKNTGGGKFTIKISKKSPAVAASREAAQSTVIMPKKNKALQDAVNSGIEAMKKDGTIVDILKKNGLEASAADTGAPRLIK